MDTLSQKIANCMSLKSPKSFLLKAGAGAGKTRALVEALNKVSIETATELILSNRKIAVITYTNAASEEIIRRLNQSPFIQVSTIHSFIWELIKHYQHDIKEWMIAEQIKNAAEARAKITPRSRRDYEADALAYEKKAEELRVSKGKFIYSPTGTNIGKNSLQHSHVLKMGGDFLGGNEEYPMKQTLRDITVARFPILLIDECQDTQKNLMQAFLNLQEKHHQKFSIGLFGDAMQRIYMDGLPNLYELIPDSWESFQIDENNRSPKRIIEVVNLIRKDADGLVQIQGKNELTGEVRFFICSRKQYHDDISRIELEQNIAELMADHTKDEDWASFSSVKRLTLEHKMAARRDGFISLAECFDKLPRSKQNLYSVASGDSSAPSIAEIALFTHRILPLIDSGDDYFQANFIKKHSLLFDRKKFKLKTGSEILESFEKARNAIAAMRALFEKDTQPLLGEIATVVADYDLFFIPDNLKRALGLELQVDTDQESASDQLDEEAGTMDDIQGWVQFLQLPFSQITKYYNYFKGESSFGTHQGVKGLQFDRVMVVIDDSEARSNTFNYARLFSSFGDSNISTDQIERTKRLFYVVCSRSQKSLAVLIYADDTNSLNQSLTSSGLCAAEEIVMVE